jgi:hypothetical protein
MGLSSPEMCFGASSPEDCLLELRKWQCQSGTGCTLYEIIKDALSPTLDLQGQIRMAFQSTITMFAIISALHVLIFNSDPRIGQTSQYMPIYNGLSNWQAVWNRRKIMLQCSPRELGQTGFWQHCPDYWLLAKLFIRQITQFNGQYQPRAKPLRPCYDEESQRRLHGFISQYESSQPCGAF